MQLLGKETKLFKNVFPDYDTFSNYCKSSPIGTSLDYDFTPSRLTFALLFCEYACSHIAFSEEDFKNHFALSLWTYAKEFEQTTERIDALSIMSEDELLVGGSTVLNLADIPETESSTNVDEVNFVSQQQKNISYKSKLQIKREQLSNARAYTTKSFLNKFRHLFIKVISNAYTELYGEPEGE